MKQPQTRILFEYWNRLRQSRAMPERCDIDPAEIRSVLADTFILEVDKAQTYPVRLAGARLNALFLRELKGAAFTGLWQDSSDSDDIAKLLRSVCDDTLGIVVGLAGTPFRGPDVDLELLALPLRHYGRTHARILGSLVVTRSQSWSGLAPLRLHAVSALRVLTQRDLRAAAAQPTGDAPAPRQTGLRLVAESQAFLGSTAQPAPRL